MSDTLSPNDVLSKTRGFYSSLSTSEKKVADSILEHSKDIIRMTLADVAQETGVSDATVLRYCRSVGYKRWLEFKIDLTQMLPNLPEQILDEVVDVSERLAGFAITLRVEAELDLSDPETSAVAQDLQVNSDTL